MYLDKTLAWTILIWKKRQQLDTNFLNYYLLLCRTSQSHLIKSVYPSNGNLIISLIFDILLVQNWNSSYEIFFESVKRAHLFTFILFIIIFLHWYNCNTLFFEFWLGHCQKCFSRFLFLPNFVFQWVLLWVVLLIFI